MLTVISGGCTNSGDSARKDGSTSSPSSGSPSSSTTKATTTKATTTTIPEPEPVPYPTPPGVKVKTQASGFTITETSAGEKPPQFIVASFDGSGWHEKWEFWRAVQEKVPFHFTGFLSGTYLLSETTKDTYVGPGHNPGVSSIAWASADELPVEIDDLNEALDRGDEIGSHFNGHFCSGVASPVGSWTTADWNNEMDQFNSFITDVDANNDIDAKLDLAPGDIKGVRTPCLEGDPTQMYPAFQSHGIIYDSSVTRSGLLWPQKDEQHSIWQIGMSTFPMFGGGRPVITMDYNFYYRQREASSEGVTPEESAADSEQVLGTYRDMYHAAFTGNRAPLILGNHFNQWNNGAYQNAMASFIKETCGKPETYCVPFIDLVDWMQAQDPAYLADVQGLPAEMGPRP
ncbi:MAG: hypothetical protein JWO77_1329 [Ilumatobacteraceae bacterium]|nr:hypothetical protein [Ilumatobacteraceae bacterium]